MKTARFLVPILFLVFSSVLSAQTPLTGEIRVNVLSHGRLLSDKIAMNG